MSGGIMNLSDQYYYSALDIFGGNGVTFDECIDWNKHHK